MDKIKKEQESNSAPFSHSFQAAIFTSKSELSATGAKVMTLLSFILH